MIGVVLQELLTFTVVELKDYLAVYGRNEYQVIEFMLCLNYLNYLALLVMSWGTSLALSPGIRRRIMMGAIAPLITS